MARRFGDATYIICPDIQMGILQHWNMDLLQTTGILAACVRSRTITAQQAQLELRKLTIRYIITERLASWAFSVN